jgi:5-methylcytosine-specific restriction endonuclease McrA
VIHSREKYRFVVLEPCLTWLNTNCCGGCGKPRSEWIKPRHAKCCSVECTTKMQSNYIYFGWPQLREKVLKRDNYRCVKCDSQPSIKIYNHTSWNDDIIEKLPDEHGVECWLIIDKSKLIADHIIPIAVGGAEWDINNIQTLCSTCNKIKTARDMKLIAIERKIPLSQVRL